MHEHPGGSADAAVGRRRATISDVAARAGVATSTVSRALSSPDRISAPTRALVEQAARELGYVPYGRRPLQSRPRAGAVGLLVPDITNPFYFGLIRGAQEQLKASGYAHVLVDTEESGDVEAASLERLRDSSDGVILTAPRLSDRQVAAAAALIPLVTLNRRVAGVATVIIDTAAAVEQAVEHLVSLGHRRVAYVSGPPASWSNEWRWRTCRAACERLKVQTVRVGPFPPKTTSGAGAADALLNSGATGCIAFNDLIAIGMLQRFASRGVAVPGDVSVVGCDDIFGADFCNPPLTTLTAPIERAGRVAITTLMNLIDGAPGGGSRQRTLLPTHLTIRASTGPARQG